MAAQKKKKKFIKRNKPEAKKDAQKTPEKTESIVELTSTETPKKPKRIKKIKLDKINFHSKKLHLTLVLLAVIVPVSAVGIYYYAQYMSTQNELVKFKQNPQAAAVEDLIDSVGKHVDLPQNETPTIATITDVDLLKEQPFFARAQNGDKILIYQNNNRTILYRPLTDKIVETLSISIENAEELTQKQEPKDMKQDEKKDEQKKDQSDEQTEKKSEDKSEEQAKDTENNAVPEGLENPIEISIYNGTGISGLASSLRSRVNKEFRTYDSDVVGIGDAQNSYPNTVVAAFTDIGESVVQDYAEFVGGQVVEDLENERPIVSDVVIIIGIDYTENN